MSKLLFSGKREWEASFGGMTEMGTGEKGRIKVSKIKRTWEMDISITEQVRESNSLSPVHESEQGLMSYELSQEPPFSQIP